MANYSAESAVHKTLAAGVEDRVVFNLFARSVEIINRDGAGEIFYRVDGGHAVVAGNDNGILPAAVGSVEERVEKLTGTADVGKIVVSLVASANVMYSVLLVDPVV